MGKYKRRRCAELLATVDGGSTRNLPDSFLAFRREAPRLHVIVDRAAHPLRALMQPASAAPVQVRANLPSEAGISQVNVRSFESHGVEQPLLITALRHVSQLDF